MESEKMCVAIIRDSMYMGGIENYVYKSFKDILENGDVPLWITKNYDKVDSVFSEFIFGSKLCRCKKNEATKYLKKLCLEFDIKRIKIVTFNTLDYCKSEIIKKRLSSSNNIEISTFLFVPHFKGEFLYLEEGFLKNQQITKRLGDIYKRMEKNSNIRYFSERHLKEFRNRYGCQETNFNKVKVPSTLNQVHFDKSRIKKVYNRKEFVILSVSRLEFPHKGYILGLIKDFNILCKKYDNLRLVIIGDGNGKAKLIEIINSLNADVRDKISVIGTVESDKLSDYYDDANVLVSLAGCFTRGARRGVLSLPARHYSEKCEVYGYLPSSKGSVLSEEKGMELIPFIEEIINMSFDEYYYKCKECFKTYEYLNDAELYYDQIKNTSNNTLKVHESLYLQLLFIHNKVKYIFKLCTNKENRE